METASPFVWGGGGARMTPEQIDAQKKVAQALMEKGMDYSPVQSPWQGAARVAQALYGGLESGMADKATAENAKANQEMIASLLGGGGGATPATTGSVPNAGIEPMGRLPSMSSRLYEENEFNPIDAQVATPTELAAGVPAPKKYAALIGKAAVDNDLPPALLAAQIKQESGFNPNAVSPVGATGISQFMPGTAREMGVNPLDPASAIPGGAQYLRQNIDKFGGSIPLGLAAYNAGPGRVERSGGDISRLPAETQGYVRNITSAAPVQTAQASPMAGVNPKVIEAATSPYSSPQTKAIANIILQQQMKQGQQENDPLRQLQIKKAERDLADGKNPESVREYEYAKNNGFAGSFSDWIAGKRAGAGEYGLNAIWGKGPDGNPAIIQLGKGGKPILTPMPEGFQPNKDAQKVDLGTHWGILDPTTRQMVTTIPKDLAGKERAEAIGKGQGEAAVSLDSMKSKMPGLEKVVGELDKLSKDATYTLAGQGVNFIGRQLGMEPRDAAVARSNYISMVDNQVLPLLRDTFGAAFTVKEGETLRNTLGDPDKTPTEKQVVLKSFIEQKRRDVEALERRVGGQSSSPSKGKTSSGVEWSVE